MVIRTRTFYTDAFKERAIAAYYNSTESVSMIAQRFGVNRDTFSSWVYRQRTSSNSAKKPKLADLNSALMKKADL